MLYIKKQWVFHKPSAGRLQQKIIVKAFPSGGHFLA